ncbi:hypothetical protein [Burkholderia pseudomultivorans]|uniref:hypothetical protein n=1 Tax=Burkholderia pseudomultivorans TaxID=1207504 RepID=UPI0012D86F5C|nr:hypothetical protein [Burkholderia pseudomultivorans]
MGIDTHCTHGVLIPDRACSVAAVPPRRGRSYRAAAIFESPVSISADWQKPVSTTAFAVARPRGRLAHPLDDPDRLRLDRAGHCPPQIDSFCCLLESYRTTTSLRVISHTPLSQRPPIVRASGRANTGGPFSRFPATPDTPIRAKLTEKSSSRQGFNGMRARS